MAARKKTSARSSSAADRIIDVDVAEEMSGSFLEYAYSVIYSRALPDARDGLKPVQRRILFQMAQMGLRPDRGHVKSARVVGEVMGRLHPHGDSAIYDALVRLAQPFTMRVPLIDGHGNFGSLDDGPAAMRYTEARLAAPSIDLTAGLDEDVVDFAPNYDGREREPIVLPAAFPNLLVNGASGIAVGMATNLVPHNLAEVIAAARHLISKPNADVTELMAFVPGPDFPGGGEIVGLDGVREAYTTGRGSFRLRASTTVENVTPRRKGIVVTALPASVGPERVIERIKDLVQAKKISGISDVVDLSDGESGLRLVIEMKSGIAPEPLLEQLYRLTPMEDSITINAVALVDGQPRTLSLRELLEQFVEHRFEVIKRRSTFRRDRAQERAHLVAGLLIAIIDIDEVIELIRDSDNAAAAKDRLMSVFDLSDAQATYILDMPLRRLTKFSRIELETEADQLRSTIEDLEGILADDDRLRAVVSEDLAELASRLGTPRRTVLLEGSVPVAAKQSADLEVPDEPCVALLSSTGLVARTSMLSDSHQPPGLSGSRAAHDVIVAACPTTTRSTIGAVTSRGRVVPLDVVDLPGIPPVSGTPALAAGVPVGAFIELLPDEQILELTPLDGTTTLALGTRSGVVKRVQTAPASGRTKAQTVISLADSDVVVGARALPEAQAESSHLAFVTSAGNLVYFPAASVRVQGSGAGGMAGVKVPESSWAISFDAIVDESIDQAVVVTVAGDSRALPGTELGSVKVTPLTAYPAKGRGTQGVRCHKLRAGEDGVRMAWIGPGPARAATASGAAVDLPEIDERRDATGTPPSAPIAGVAGSLR